MAGERRDTPSQRQSRADDIDREIGEASERLVKGKDGGVSHRVHTLTRERARLLAPSRRRNGRVNPAAS
ncbi:MAG: hypothetical protein GVY33_13885 [Alphaproteobacteria bacterium]|jgi:hypothetical protein|nr:hypothetical protein [Alphaproteobacteria bacterium]